MQCTHPSMYTANGVFITTKPPCGKCLPCRTSKRREWTSRLVLENKAHAHSSFVTFTFSPTALDSLSPETASDYKYIWRKFMQRWYEKARGRPRYFSAFEFGTSTGRPHFHAIIFGRKPFLSTVIQFGNVVTTDLFVEDLWGHGFTYSKDCATGKQELNIMRYTANYVLKETNKPDGTPRHLPFPEFSLKSRKPYIGKLGMKYLVDALTTRSGARHLGILGTCPKYFKAGKQYLPIPTRMRREICEELDIEYFELPWLSDIIIDIDGFEVIKEVPRVIKTQEEAGAEEKAFIQRVGQFTSKRSALTN